MSTMQERRAKPERSLEKGTARRRRLLLGCGIAYGVVYILSNDAIAASFYRGYSRLDQTVSELSAVSAPTRPFIITMLFIYTALMIAFGIGVWQSADGSRALRITGALIVAFGITGILWLPFPISDREDMVGASTMSANDVGHLVLSGLTALLIIAMCVAAAVHFGVAFRIYTVVTLLAVVVFSGALTAIQSAKLTEGDPTPLLGFYERTGMGAYLLWFAVLAVLLLKESRSRT